MFCPRCGGMMIPEHFQEIRDKNGRISHGLRCILCGEVLDPVILQNRSDERTPERHPRHLKFVRS